MLTSRRDADRRPTAGPVGLDEVPVTEAHLAQLRRELDEQLAWGHRRHDVEMRTAALRLQLDRVLAHLQSILDRYELLHAEGLVSACAPLAMMGALRAAVETVRRHFKAADPFAEVH